MCECENGCGVCVGVGIGLDMCMGLVVDGLGPDRGLGEGQEQLVIAAYRFRFWGSASCDGA